VAREIGIPVPDTFRPPSMNKAESLIKHMNFPVVIKHTIGSGRKSVRIARNRDDFRTGYALLSRSQPRPMIQEYVPGGGYGYFALLRKGEVLVEMTHKRIHEYPPEGGPSTMARSVYLPMAREMGRKLLRALNWSGVAMVEFRGEYEDESVNGGLKLLEVNPKFWGSLDLAIASGLDFPYLTYCMARGDPLPDHRGVEDIVFRWIHPDLDFSLDTGRMMRYIAEFVDPSIKSDLDLEDPGPLAYTIRRMASGIFRRMPIWRRH
jgi:predicted ATP-grasp superfamily ATP-dependent carboligase